MAPIAEPQADLAPLPKADGSATYSYNGYTVTSAVNGPIEAQRRDENPFEAIIDVNIRPAAGVGGTAERVLESILQRALRQLIPIRNFPRSMIQITLQVTETPENAYANTKVVQAQLNLAIIPVLLHAAILSLLTGAIPLKTIATAVTLAVRGADGGGIVADPSAREADTARSLHVLGFTADDELLLAESQGTFTVDEWAAVLAAGQEACGRAAPQGIDEDAAMADGGEAASVRAFIRSVMETKIAADMSWKK
ncbi:ribosomal protein S5 domain 2-type fold domain containing protein [Cordyceps militaris CM01]|uniref:Ribosomal protein S5 domain 2-type fold domain containing protein n=1 Tax=Cordyceps militaris (strain CM01) TaxID=983644 RepID=G3JJ75_CORMM|nr:ribosomal protein S5 domain 2-type fold domain containing protein [Cordyceps militaris CM01]EGX92017.1 ribosomal protein S5 domain 2-type fold domain containing protein [Cordyceps militaris CM01]